MAELCTRTRTSPLRPERMASLCKLWGTHVAAIIDA